jgi:hypothetical protein
MALGKKIDFEFAKEVAKQTYSIAQPQVTTAS